MNFRGDILVNSSYICFMYPKDNRKISLKSLKEILQNNPGLTKKDLGTTLISFKNHKEVTVAESIDYIKKLIEQ